VTPAELVRNGQIMDNTNNATMLLMYTSEMLEIQHKINNDLLSHVTIKAACDTYVPIMFSAANKKIIYYIEKKATYLDSIITLERKYAAVVDQDLNNYVLNKNLHILCKQLHFKEETIGSQNALINFDCDDGISGLILSIKKTDITQEMYDNLLISVNIHYKNGITNQLAIKQYVLTEMSQDPDMHLYSSTEHYLFQVEMNSSNIDFFRTHDTYGIKITGESSINVCINADISSFNMKIMYLVQKTILYCRTRPIGIRPTSVILLNRDYAGENAAQSAVRGIFQQLFNISPEMINRPVEDGPRGEDGTNTIIPESPQGEFQMVLEMDTDDNSDNNSDTMSEIDPLDLTERSSQTRRSQRTLTTPNRTEPEPDAMQTPPGVNVAYPDDMPPEIRNLFNNLVTRGSPRGTSGQMTFELPINLFGGTPQSEQNINDKKFDLNKYLELHSETLIRLVKSYEMDHATESADKVDCSVNFRRIKIGEYYYKCYDEHGKDDKGKASEDGSIVKDYVSARKALNSKVAPGKPNILGNTEYAGGSGAIAIIIASGNFNEFVDVFNIMSSKYPHADAKVTIVCCLFILNTC
jgi:hypothetical protein